MVSYFFLHLQQMDWNPFEIVNFVNEAGVTRICFFYCFLVFYALYLETKGKDRWDFEKWRSIKSESWLHRDAQKAGTESCAMSVWYVYDFLHQKTNEIIWQNYDFTVYLFHCNGCCQCFDPCYLNYINVWYHCMCICGRCRP